MSAKSIKTLVSSAAIAAFLGGQPLALFAAADLNAQLVAASRKGDASAVEQLLAQRANPDAQDSSGSTALLEAASNGHPDVVDSLLKAGADPSKRDSPLGNTALVSATIRDDVQTMGLLIAHWADFSKMNAKDRVILKEDSMGRTALIEAADLGYVDAAKLLLVAYSVDPNQKDKLGTVPLIAAATGNNAQIVSLLLSAGASPTETDLGDSSALSLAKTGYFKPNIAAMIEQTAQAQRRAQDIKSAQSLNPANWN
jgi:ankyrin repeat protein